MRDDRRQRLLRASATRASIEHPNLVPARLVRDNGGRRVRLVLLECSAPRLDEVLSSGPLSGKECLKVVYGAASAADALARHGLVAIDLRPSRVLVDPKRGGILADQGFPAGMSKPEPARRDAEAVYRSPEERDRHDIDGRSNVYSLGAILWAALTGAPPLRAHHGGVPAAIEAVITRAMEVEPARRYSGAREFVLAGAAAFESQSEAVRPTDAVSSTRR